MGECPPLSNMPLIMLKLNCARVTVVMYDLGQHIRKQSIIVRTLYDFTTRVVINGTRSKSVSVEIPPNEMHMWVVITGQEGG